jgi:NADH:ubiquinone oxidoreductase subunit E
MMEEQFGKIIENHQGELGSLISILEDIQEKYHYLPGDALRTVARKTGYPLVDIYGVATFYKAFSLKPRGRHLVSVCMGTACHVRSSPAILDEFTRQLGLKPGETSADKEFTLETVNCLGTCALGPIVMADGHYFSNVKRGDVKKIIQKVKSGLYEKDTRRDEDMFPVEVYCPYCNQKLMDVNNSIEDYPSILLNGSFDGTQGWVRMSGLYGNSFAKAEHQVPPDTKMVLSCPNCQTRFQEVSTCTECGSPMVPLVFQGGGSLLVCERWGCTNRMINLNSIWSPEKVENTSQEQLTGK